MVVYADDGFFKGKLSVELQVLTELKCVLKEDVGLEFNVSKTSVLLEYMLDVREHLMMMTFICPCRNNNLDVREHL